MTKTVADDDTFVTLMRVVQEDPGIRRTFIGILTQSPFQRKSLLNTLIREMALKGAPLDFVSAINALVDDVVADRALMLLLKK